MAFGISPGFTEDLYLEKFTPEQFLALAVEASRLNNWQLTFISETGFIAHTNRGRFKWNAEITFKIQGEQVVIISKSVGNEIIDWGRNRRVIRKFSDALIDLKYSIKAEELNSKYEVLKEEFVPDEQDVLKLPEPSAAQRAREAFSILIPRKGYFITPILVYLNVWIFILMMISGVSIFLPDNESLIQWGANFRPVTLEGQWWRLITNCFLHIGIFHLLMNMYALVYIGLLLEPHLGKAKFLAAYLLAGVTASVASLWWNDLSISAGASGAIFGMYGIFLALLTTKLIEKETRKPLLMSIGIFVAYNLAYGMKGGIDNAAHLGGLIGGLVMGYAFLPSLKRPADQTTKYSTIVVLAVVIFTVSFGVYRKIPNDIAAYEEKMKSFVSMEQMALGVFQLPRNAPKDKVLYEIKDRGLYYWNENIKLLNEVEALHLSELLHEQNQKLIHYCNLRIKSYELIYKSVDEDTDKYKKDLEIYEVQIQEIIKSLKQQ